MKHSIILATIILLCATCKKNSLGFPIWEPDDTSTGTCNGFRNEEAWTSSVIANHSRTQLNQKIDSVISIYFITGEYSEDRVEFFRREYLIFGPFSKKPGKYLLAKDSPVQVETSPISSYGIFFAGGDSAGFMTELREKNGVERFLLIESIDEITNEITGKFETTYLLCVDGDPYYDLPDKVSFSDCRFKAILQD